jgi:hypothetical protein
MLATGSHTTRFVRIAWPNSSPCGGKQPPPNPARNIEIQSFHQLDLGTAIATTPPRSDRVDRFATLLLTSLGIACIYAGYKLFCGLPALNGQTSTSRSSVLLLNVIPGILLALIGTGLLTAEAHGILSRRSSINRHESQEGTSWHLHKHGLMDRDRAA